MDCMVLDQGDDVLVVNRGVAFPHDDLGMDLLHPRFGLLLVGRSGQGVFITHGHEDHIGAVPCLLD